MNPLHLVRNALLPLGRHLGSRPTDGDSATLLILQPDHLGDILLSQPAVIALREALPNYRLIAVVGPWSEHIAKLAWPVDDIVAVAFPGFTRSSDASVASPYIQLQQDAAELRKLHAGSAVILRPDAWWAAWLARLSVPGDVATADDPRASHFATVTTPLDAGIHAAERSFAIAGRLLDAIQVHPAVGHPEQSGAECPLGATDPISGPHVPRTRNGILRGAQDDTPKLSSPANGITLQARPTLKRNLNLPTNDTAGTQARQLLADHGVTGGYIVVHPGSGARVKLWPPARWRAVISRLGGMNVVLTGSESERGLAAAVATDFDNVRDLSGMTSLDVLIEVLRGADAVAGPDSGPLHLAVATGTPTVHLFGPSDPARYGPWGPSDRHRVISAGWTCPRCGDLSPERRAGCGCMLAITPDTVAETIHELAGRNEH